MDVENEVLEVLQLDVSTGDAASALAYEVTDPADISPGSTDNLISDIPLTVPIDVSGGDVQTVPQSQTPVLSSEIGYTSADPIDYTDSLTHIEQLLSLIVFLFVFDWCCRRIKNIVRMFTGRNLK